MRKKPLVTLLFCMCILVSTKKGQEASPSEDTRPTLLMTVDDGPNQYTRAIAKKLLAENIEAIWFITDGPGNLDKRKSDVEFLLSRGFVIGNHTKSHNYQFIRTSAIPHLRRDLEYVNDYMATNFGYKLKYLRSPFGYTANFLLCASRDLGLEVLPWHITFEEHKHKVLTRKVIQDILVLKEWDRREEHIVLIHSSQTSLKAFDIMIPELRKYGKFGTVDCYRW